MSNPIAPHRKYPNTYFVQDQENEVELARLQLQDQMLTTSMGGVLSEQPDPTSLQRVLDVGCGTGGWLIEVAKASQKHALLVGVDVNQRLLSYAHAQAEAQGVSDRVQFRFMDALSRLQFPDHYFDLVNQRFGTSFLRKWDWATLLHEYRRVTRPGGVIRITEFDVGDSSSSPALLRLSDLFVQALYRAGHFFTREYNGLTNQLTRLLHQQDLQNVQTHAWTLEYRAGTPQGDLFIEDIRHLYRTLLPFLRKWTCVPADYETIYHQALTEMRHPDFVATMNLLTASGTKRDH